MSIGELERAPAASREDCNHIDNGGVPCARKRVFVLKFILFMEDDPESSAAESSAAQCSQGKSAFWLEVGAVGRI